MQEIKAFNEKRAEIYWWFSSLFAKELTEAELEQYHSPEIRTFLTGLGENPTLNVAATRVNDALNRLLDREDAQLELSADFCDLFLKSDKDSALPYASMYIGETGLLDDKPARDIEAVMAQYNVAVQKDLNEPADHLAIELDLLGNIIIRSNELEQERHLDEALADQHTFIEQHLLSWVPKFSTKCQSFDEFGFYSAVVALLVSFLELDRDYLAGE
ncbi:molecular chaperone TorD [Vibrio sinensis]|uniref:Chaperone protein TorD n=1 Tax=Vibrio sinensis TaxID=2302434 RepID=A0A3A6QT17_9VIBR|nr:molecular chaperone TorD [Vibrio sinensis]RJX73756.1 molecular chaperone TorD [Vibrio sinensis]